MLRLLQFFRLFVWLHQVLVIESLRARQRHIVEVLVYQVLIDLVNGAQLACRLDAKTVELFSVLLAC
jgi:hypothetical protein